MSPSVLHRPIVSGIPLPRGVRSLAIGLSLVSLVASAPAVLLLYDSFDYTAGETLGSGSSGADWENAKSNITLVQGSLNYGGLQDSSGNRVNVDGGRSNLDGVRTVAGSWIPQTQGTLYVSFLLNLKGVGGIATSGDGSPILNISQEGSGSRQLVSVNLLNDTVLKLGVLKYPSSSSSVSSAFFASGPAANLSADGTTTYLVVAKYEWVDGADNDVVTVWVNPGNLGGAEDGGNKVSTSTGADGPDNAGRLYINRGPTLTIDELRIGQSWAEVTPTGGPVIQPQPYIAEGLLAPGGFVLRGSNGTPAGVFQVLSSPDLLLPASSWPSIATHRFDAGGHFDCTNPVPADASRSYYQLRMGGELPTAPAITSHPLNQTVIAGQNALFNVAATGSEPLAYQWHVDGTPISGAIAAAYTVSNAQTNHAGGYHVMITNSVGSVTSTVARLTVVPSPTVGVPDAYATVGSGTTGGAGGPTVTVDNFTDFEFYVDNDTGPYIVLVSGTINLGGSNVRVRDDKTIIGLGADAVLVGDLKVFRNNNVIMQNLTFTNPGGAGDKDGLSLQDCRNVWVDHCTFYDASDGNLDISHAADWVTVSWCHFYYTDPGLAHRFSNLIGHSDNNAGEDAGTLHVTYHHNWWGQNVHERMPRVRFGRVHLYNNYFNAPGNNYCIRAARDCEILVENNYFDSVKNVWELYRTTGTDGSVYATNNVEVATTWSSGDPDSIQIPGTDVLSAQVNGLNPPPYAYTLDAASTIPGTVTDNAGAGKGPFAPDSATVVSPRSP